MCKNKISIAHRVVHENESEKKMRKKWHVEHEKLRRPNIFMFLQKIKNKNKNRRLETKNLEF